MRTIVDFTVSGKTKEELLDKAKKKYQDFMGNDSEVLPGTAVIEFNPEIEERTEDGRVIVEWWTASVHISANTNDSW